MLPAKLSDRLYLLQWGLPTLSVSLALFYQFVLATYLLDHFGVGPHFWLEVFLYGLTGPVGVWLVIRLLRRWLEQKEQAEAEVYRLNAELQQRVDERTRELREKNRELAAANKRLQELDLLKSEFISLVSHELRTPLTNLRGAVELMESGCPDHNPICSRMFRIVSSQIQRQSRLVEDVLSVSRLEAGELTLIRQIVDVSRIADRVVDEFATRSTGHRVMRLLTPEHPLVAADADRLHQVISNLVDNAIKYSPKGSEVAVTIHVGDGEGVISVSDQGPGIPPEEQERIFEKFHRLDTGDSKETYGFGLGLFICRRLIEAMEGRIWVESQPGHGATFSFALPIVQPEGMQTA